MSTDPRAKKITEVALKVGARPSYLDALINFETAGTYDPLIPSGHADSTAVGLIQINDPTARDLFGMSAQELVNKYPTFDEQMDNVVLPYLLQRKQVYNDGRPLFTKHELFMSVFYPAYIKADPDTEFSQAIIDANGGKIRTPADYVTAVSRLVKKESLLVSKALPIALTGAAAIGTMVWFVSRKKRSRRL